MCNHAIWLNSDAGEQTAQGFKKYCYSPQAYFLCNTDCVANQMWYVSVLQIYHWITDLHDFPQIVQQLLGTTQALQEHCCQMRTQWRWNRLSAFSLDNPVALKLLSNANWWKCCVMLHKIEWWIKADSCVDLCFTCFSSPARTGEQCILLSKSSDHRYLSQSAVGFFHALPTAFRRNVIEIAHPKLHSTFLRTF